ncbi:MAG: tRNA 2-thiouridine(34) synthase MnmA [Planctomycetes bacterium]|nr:tRNA 2-thiouridine(34) synthase MnmA [Planctomycetota bacterium]
MPEVTSGKAERVVVAMSGGVDSSVAAALLREQGHEVVGLFMRNGIAPGAAASRGKQGCCSLEDSMDARQVAARLDIPFYALDFSVDFGRIMDYFAAEYDAGRTPNPCIQCNRWLKFGKLLEQADAIGARRVATGHYARLLRRDDRLAVARGLDRDKDQSYLLFPLEQWQLERSLLPLGELEKSEVRERARDLGLAVHDKPDSQEICFVPDDDYRGFLRRRAPETLRPGPVVDLEGRELGRHEGHQLYTIGQRRGLGGGNKSPRYVVAIRPEDNVVVVGGPDDLLAGGLVIGQPTFQGIGPLAPGETIAGDVKIRSRHEATPAELIGAADGSVTIRFASPERAVTPGQAAVFYLDDLVLVGGFIDRVLDAGPRR